MKKCFFFFKKKGIYHTMNLLSVESTKKCLIAECWIPNDDVPRVREALIRGNVIFDFLVNYLFNLIFLKRTHCIEFLLISLNQF